MTEHPQILYKPGLTMDEPIAVTLAAADWAIFMTWISGLPDEVDSGMRHILYGAIAPQIQSALYSQASIQAAKARVHEQQNQISDPIRRIMESMGGQIVEVPTPEAFTDSMQGHFRATCGCTCPENMGPICNGECHIG